MSKNTFIRHTLATINFRANASIVSAPSSLAEARASDEHWTALQILRHMNDVLEWALSIARGKQEWNAGEPGSWQEEVENFYCVLRSFDDLLVDNEIQEEGALCLLQGPLADVLTHVGQLASLRRACGSPVAPQNYAVAAIEAGQIGPGTDA